MLSAESAVGDFPIEAVQTMNSVAEKVESDDMYRKIIASVRKVSKDSIAQAITVAAREIAELHDVRAICCFTFSGTTALSAAREKTDCADYRADSVFGNGAKDVFGVGIALRDYR